MDTLNAITLNMVQTYNQILEGFIQTLFDWSKTWGFSSCTSIPEFISSLYLLSHDVYLWCVSVHALCTLHSFAIKFLILPIKKNGTDITSISKQLVLMNIIT